MNKEQITLYCKKEGWAVPFKNKFVFSQQYERGLVAKCVGSQYKRLSVSAQYYYSYETDERYRGEEIREVYTYDYIIRDFEGNPVTVSDLPYSYQRKRKSANINIEDGRPIPGTGVRKGRPYKNVKRRKRGAGFLKQCLSKETETEDGIKIPEIRKKVKNSLVERKFWLYYDGPLSEMNDKSWKKYRKNQWKK